MKDAQLFSQIRKAVQRDDADTVLHHIRHNMHLAEDTTGKTIVVFHDSNSHEIIECITEALVEYDAADLFRELCLRNGLEHGIQNLPAPGDIYILDLARQKQAKALVEAILAQDGVSKIPKALPAPSTPAKSGPKPTQVPQYLSDFHYALKSSFGGVAASGIFEQAQRLEPQERMKRLNAIVIAGLTHAITTLDESLAYTMLRQAQKSADVSQSVMQQMANVAGAQAFKFEADSVPYKKLFAIAVQIRDAAKTMGRPADFAGAHIADAVLSKNPVIQGVDLG